MPESSGNEPKPAGEPIPMADAQIEEAAEYYLESDNLPQGISEDDTSRIKMAAERLERERLHAANPKLRPEMDDG